MFIRKPLSPGCAVAVQEPKADVVFAQGLSLVMEQLAVLKSALLKNKIHPKERTLPSQ